jgi:hypothetical protein
MQNARYIKICSYPSCERGVIEKRKIFDAEGAVAARNGRAMLRKVICAS